MFRNIFVISLTVLLFSVAVFGQEGKHAPASKAKDLFEKAQRSYYKKDYVQAITYCNKAKEIDHLYEDPYKMIGTIYSLENKYENEKAEYLELLKYDPMNTMCLVNLGAILFKHGEYAEAKKYYTLYLSKNGLRDELRKVIVDRMKKIDVIVKIEQHPVDFNPVNAGPGINSKVSEYFPTLTVDGETMYFTRKKESPVKGPHNDPSVNPIWYNEDIMVSHKVNGEWQKAVDAPGINTEQNEGATCISPDGSIMLFASCDHRDVEGGRAPDNCDIYISFLENGKWSKPKNIGEPINSQFYETQPSISFDNKTIYFVSNRPGGFGGLDIYKCTIQDDRTLGPAINLGPTINTSDEECSPFIHPDDQTLYFSSKGWLGMGNRDIFYSRKKENGEFDSAINIGYPINTPGDEFGLIVDATGENAYYASSGKNSIGGLDIFTFKMPPNERPKPVTYLKGKVFDAETKKTLAATFELVDIVTGKSVIKKILLNDGEFLIPLPSGKNYLVNVSASGYLFYSDNIPLKDYKNDKPYVKDIPLPPLKVGEKITLKNIFFATDKFELLQESFNELDRLIALLNANPSLKIEISGHTDNAGSAEHNKELSLKRAQSVFNYLVKKGNISATRLKAVGYGDSQPNAPNATPEGMAQNRRTEIKII